MIKHPVFPFVVAVIFLWICTAVFFLPVFKDQVLLQQDIIRHKGMSKDIVDFRSATGEEPLWTNRMFGGMPAFQISTLYSGNWLSYPDVLMKLFMPLPAGYLFMYMFCFLILMWCIDVKPLIAVTGALAYGFSSYFLIILEAGHNSKANAIGYLPALVGGVYLIFNSSKRYVGFILVTLFTALELNANHVQISYYGYILLACILVYFAIEALQKHSFKAYTVKFLVFLLASIMGVLPNAGNLVSTKAYSVHTTRGPSKLNGEAAVLKQTPLDEPVNPSQMKLAQQVFNANKTSGLDADYATQWSYGIGETLTLLIPNFKGGSSQALRDADKSVLKGVNPEFAEQVLASSAYFGDQPFTSGPVYAGAIICFLAILAMFYVEHPFKWALFAATLLSIVLSWGHHVMGITKWCMDVIPGYNKFRAVSMTLVIAELTLPLLAVMALKQWIQNSTQNTQKQMRALKWALICTGGLCLVMIVIPQALVSFSPAGESEQLVQQAAQSGISKPEAERYIMQLMPEIEHARKQLLTNDATRSLVLILLTALILFGYVKLKSTKNSIRWAIGLGILILIMFDLWNVNRRYITNDAFISKAQEQAMITVKSAADEDILKDQGLGHRVLNLSVSPFNDAQTSYWHNSVGGYHAAKLKSYQEFIDFELEAEIKYIFKNGSALFGTDSARAKVLQRLHGLNMLNTKYFILPGGETGNSMAFKNSQAYGSCWFVRKVEVVKNTDEVLLQLRSNPNKYTAWVTASDFKTSKVYNADNSELQLVTKTANACTYTANCKSDAFAVFSEIYYSDGWHVVVDGKPSTYLCVNSILRGMELKPGSHRIEFKFEPEVYKTSNTVSLIGSIVLFCSCLIAGFLDRKQGDRTIKE